MSSTSSVVVCQFSPTEIMVAGLLLVGFSEHRQGRVKTKTNKSRFKRMFGSSARALAALWDDLQRIKDPNYRLQVPESKALTILDFFLITMHFIKKYPDEVDQSSRFDWSDRTIREKKWYMLQHIQYFKKKKIRWPKEWEADPNSARMGDIRVFLVSVDGVHCQIQEPQHGEWSKNPKYYSHKFKKAGLAYEVALSVYENKCVSINGPYPASTNDTTIFKGGIRKKIPEGRRAIVDNGYKGKHESMSKPNPLDSKAVRQFKRRVRLRQECFNTRLKNFKCLKEEFRHGEEKHKICFEAVAVICQYQLENGSPLFDV